ncbi:Formate hydrogenlyase subunit 3/Multisubunit Na+/H+ antiporter, MnhD subunit [Enhydrobacter aerosaccus]|uniref:Formate hydrogenlyase subunit 3/Multisubunit Na+/H+ antiporter, MnhD subunit n=1 Tax=Enhydrobacter aerosaccus TaxID=225324 RepID=A0A1T4PYD1_9HYPH|nr:hydrogenase 4 subunit B [Enhydrobacter aerosaccus]SJZ95978.1 Formate hydrogenlyase subunit 3/Multisubunit Na+/H+ antiporter, MnhD subunit [Enhydrobacter aerosaccus]
MYLQGAALGALVVAAALAAGLRGTVLAIVYPVAAVAAVVMGVVDLGVLLQGGQLAARLPIGLPTIGGFHLRLDPLSAFFGVVINGGVLAASLYGMGLDRAKDLTPRVEPLFPLFAAAMNLVLLADDAYAFLLSWELMSLASWALVVARHTSVENRRAGHLYLVMAAIGTTALIFAFGGLAGPAGGYAFDTIRAHAPAPMVAVLVLTAALIGCGSKGGLVPLHAWLPLAHPAAPSHVSALMSGVMTKVAIYGFVRITFDLLGPAAWWWALPPIVLGAITAVLGLLYAVFDRDLKRVLAYSTVENVGLIFVALGLALAFRANNQNAAAAVAMAAALLHVLNHSWFKSLLFLGAGAVLHATGRRDLDGLGGLIHRMPRTAVFFLIGALAISALPPLNGFVSEWLLFQSVLAAPAMPQITLNFASPAIGAMLALAAALAAACFVRVYGIAFLGRPRSAEAAHAHEVSLPQQIAMGGLALLCILGGLFGSVIVLGLAPVLTTLVGSGLPNAGTGPTPFSLIAFDAARSIYDAPIIALFVAIASLTTLVVVHRLSERRTRRGPAWDCGFPDPSAATQYTASSFAQPLRRVYGAVAFSARETVVMPPPGDTRPARFSVTLVDFVWTTLYVMPGRAVLRLSERLNALQFLSIRRYLVLMFAALVILLSIATVMT